MDPRKGPKKKLPYIIDDGTAIGDSELVISHLKDKYGDPLADRLSASDKAITHAFNVMFAERFYWAAMIYPRWVRPEHHALLTETWFGMIPKPPRSDIFPTPISDYIKASPQLMAYIDRVDAAAFS